MTKRAPTQTEWDDLISAKVTLDDHPAVITGRRLPYAVVACLTCAQSAEFSWPTVARIVANGGHFHT